MREDMFKIIVERPRLGRRRATKSKLRYDKCEDRSRVSGRRLVKEHSGSIKYLNENLAPLRRFLRKQIGRKWDDVFSEICQHLDTGSTVKMHVREHISDFISVRVWRSQTGEFCTSDRWGGEVLLANSHAELYVDPDDGRVKDTRAFCKWHDVPFSRDRWKHRFQKANTPHPQFKNVGVLSWHIQLKGIWYLVKLSNMPKSAYGYEMSDLGVYEAIKAQSWKSTNEWRILRKFQLSHKDLKAHGLINTPSEMEICHDEC